MSLTYVETQYNTAVVRETKILRAPKNWGMFTSEGNKSLEKKAERLLTKLESSKSTSIQISALLSFLNSYRKMGNSKTMREAWDTAVRECVWDFFKKACTSIGLGSSANDLWEKEEE